MIAVHHLTKRYGSTVAVDDLTFDVRPGQVTGFLGPNGAGKSTTMRLILGLDRPTGGTALVNGRRYGEHRSPLREVGVLLEAGAAHPGRRAEHHLRWLAQSNRIPHRRIAEVLDLVGLADAARRRVGTFSLGMSQRLGIAAALLGDPAVVLLDEPMNGLDAEGIVWIRSLLRSLAADGRTVFVSSHLMGEMAQLADRLVVIGRGRLIADASVDEIIQRCSRPQVHVRSPQGERLAKLLADNGIAAVHAAPDGLVVSDADAGDVGDLAARHGVAVHALHTQQASLEEAFMALTAEAVEFRGAAAPLGHDAGTDDR